METIKEGNVARLPNGQKVRIESCEDDIAIVTRLRGPRKGTRAVCAIAKLQPLDQNLVTRKIWPITGP